MNYVQKILIFTLFPYSLAVQDNEMRTTNITCHSSKIFIIPSMKDNDKNESKINDGGITNRIGENVSFSCKVNTTTSYSLFWIAVYHHAPTQCLLSAEVERENNRFNSSFNKLCCPTVGSQERLHTSNVSTDTNQFHYLNITNIATSDNGHYLCIIYTWKSGGFKWIIANNQSLQVTGNEDSKPITDLSIHIVAGTIGGIVVFVGILLLIWFCIKRKGKQMKTNHSPPNAVALPDDYECTPYAVSERKDQNLRSMYSLVQAPKLATDAEYSEVEMKALGVPGAEYSEIKMKPPVVACAVYSEIELKPGGDDAYTMVGT
ncbi:uncharacterized protein LOC142149941 isoform X2 [Mixophyes fleayi]|uniref:uncharacterized protein LOC142149941 isoform X2 n=1 Tax=Mixophyes fleayi TaxID=3061075 RepID=UPI003F4DBD52